MKQTIRYLSYELFLQAFRIRAIALKAILAIAASGVYYQWLYSSKPPNKVVSLFLPMVTATTLVAMFSESFQYFKDRIADQSLARDVSFPIPRITMAMCHIAASICANMVIMLITYGLIAKIAATNQQKVPFLTLGLAIFTTSAGGIFTAIMSSTKRYLLQAIAFTTWAISTWNISAITTAANWEIEKITAHLQAAITGAVFTAGIYWFITPKRLTVKVKSSTKQMQAQHHQEKTSGSENKSSSRTSAN